MIVLRIVAIFGVLVSGAACRPAAPPLSSAYPTKEALAQAAADAFADRDAARLESLALTEKEFKGYVWPALPASKPAVGMPADYVWADTASKSRGYLAQTLADQGGRRWTVVRVSFSRPPADYGTFRVHPDTNLSLRSTDGEVVERRLFGSMIESSAGWKIYSYIVD